MAEVAWAVEDLPAGKQLPAGVRVVKWLLTGTDTGVPYYAPAHSGKAVQLTAVATGPVTIEATLVPEGITPVWSAAHDVQGTAISLATVAAGLEQILEDCFAVRPVLAAGSATVYLFVTTTARR